MASSSTLKAPQTKAQACAATTGQPAKPSWRLRLAAFLRNAGVSFMASWYLTWRYPGGEEPKVVISHDIIMAILRCWIHLAATAVVLVLVGLNTVGFFIGEELSGYSGGTFQALDQLMLQICAKATELLVVASLGKVIMDLIRHELLYSERGLPFGIMLARLQFSDIGYFWSASFWSSCFVISSFSRRLFIGVVIMLSGLIAAFAGPAAALLLIPTVHQDWHAGGTDFWLNGNENILWPITLDADAAGGTHCQSPSFDALTMGALNYSGCAWGGYTALAEFFEDTRLSPGDWNLTVEDGFVMRAASHYSGTPAEWEWSYTGHAAAGLYMRNIQDHWLTAIADAPITTGRHYTYGNYKWMSRWTSYSATQTPIPAVRASCLYWGEHAWSQAQVFEFPYIDPYGGPDSSKSYKIMTDNLTTPQAYPQTQWFRLPDALSTLLDGTVTDYYPSAFLGIQLPSATPNDTSILYTCSVDARWAPGRNVFLDPLDSLQHAELEHIDTEANGALILPKNDSS